MSKKLLLIATGGTIASRPAEDGLTPEQVILLSLVVLAAILMLTMRANSVWTGESCAEQIHQALFVTKDWE